MFLLVPLLLAVAILWWKPEYRDASWSALGRHALHVLTIAVLSWAAVAFVAHVSASRVIATEPIVLAWFVITSQLAFWLCWHAASGRRWLQHGLALAVLAPLFLGFVLTHRCKWGDGSDPHAALQLPFERVHVRTRDGLRLNGWFVPQPGADRTLIIWHGAGANKGDFMGYLGPLAGHGYNLAMFDFRAHGGSDGRVTTWGVDERLDVIAVVDWLKRDRAAQARVVVGLGSSQGALALALAGREDSRIDAFILDSPFLSPRQLARDHAAWLPIAGPLLADYMLGIMSAWSGANLLASSARMDLGALGGRPVLVIHGEQDTLSPQSHAEALLEAPSDSVRELWRGPGGHSNIITETPFEYSQRVFSFLSRTLPDASAPSFAAKDG